jgi:hypothetical protein
MTLRRLVSLFVAAALAACGSSGSGSSSAVHGGAGTGAADGPGKPLAVMTRNLYVGGDLFLPFVSQIACEKGNEWGLASTAHGQVSDTDHRIAKTH